MRLRVKDPHGTEEYRVEVESANVTVLDLKKAIEREIGEEPDRQMLVHMGQGLDDDSRKLRYYHISEGSRIFYAIKPIIRRRVPRLPQAPPPPGSEYFTKLKPLLLKHFSEADVDKIVSTIKEELKRSVDKTNLDMVERIAAESLRIHESYKTSLPGTTTSDSAEEQAAGP